jgi:hypothetical protein
MKLKLKNKKLLFLNTELTKKLIIKICLRYWISVINCVIKILSFKHLELEQSSIGTEKLLQHLQSRFHFIVLSHSRITFKISEGFQNIRRMHTKIKLGKNQIIHFINYLKWKENIVIQYIGESRDTIIIARPRSLQCSLLSTARLCMWDDVKDSDPIALG